MLKKTLRILTRFSLGLLLVVGILALAIYINPQVAPRHDSPYLSLVNENPGTGPVESALIQRVLLYGDAGHSTTIPWQASMAKVAERAAISPDKTVVVALGDNIYMRGYPSKEEGQAQWNEDQLESISFLDSQLSVAKVSGATMYLVPGNHDWYALEIDSQARHVADYAERNNLPLALEPYEAGLPPIPESVDFPGVSLVFVDSEWLIQNDDATTAPAYQKLESELARIRRDRPDNLILIAQHHPLETMGPHGNYHSDFSYWFIVGLLKAIFDTNQDLGHPDYDNYVARVNAIVAPYRGVIHAAGHEHSLQLFKPAAGEGASYNLVSGAANSNKITGVWHNDNSRFALANEGFMELAITSEGVHLSVFDIHGAAPVAAFWLDIKTPISGAATRTLVKPNRHN